MQRVRPVRMSATETAAVWVRWRRGGSISEIGRAMDRSPGVDLLPACHPRWDLAGPSDAVVACAHAA